MRVSVDTAVFGLLPIPPLPDAPDGNERRRTGHESDAAKSNLERATKPTFVRRLARKATVVSALRSRRELRNRG
jgi:hypothetical protein